MVEVIVILTITRTIILIVVAIRTIRKNRNQQQQYFFGDASRLQRTTQTGRPKQICRVLPAAVAGQVA